MTKLCFFVLPSLRQRARVVNWGTKVLTSRRGMQGKKKKKEKTEKKRKEKENVGFWRRNCMVQVRLPALGQPCHVTFVLARVSRVSDALVRGSDERQPVEQICVVFFFFFLLLKKCSLRNHIITTSEINMYIRRFLLGGGFWGKKKQKKTTLTPDE